MRFQRGRIEFVCILRRERAAFPSFFKAEKRKLVYRIRMLLSLLRQGDFRQLWQKCIAFLSGRVYSFCAVCMDILYGGVPVHRAECPPMPYAVYELLVR